MAAAASELAATQGAAATPAISEDLPAALDTIDLELPDAGPEAAPRSAAPTAIASLTTEPAPLDFDTDNLLLADSAATPLAASDAKDSAPAALEFDLGDLNLDLSLPAAPTAAAQADAGAAEPLPDDPLTTKLALAEEFNTIGDSEGARTLVEEVIAESTGELKARAQRLLAELG